ncbi:unnamed protein product [Leuciscus chuanchicus]
MGREGTRVYLFLMERLGAVSAQTTADTAQVQQGTEKLLTATVLYQRKVSCVEAQPGLQGSSFLHWKQELNSPSEVPKV